MSEKRGERRGDVTAQEKAILENAREYKQKIEDMLSNSAQSLSTPDVKGIYFYLDMMRAPSKDHALNTHNDFVTLSEVISNHTHQARLKEANLENTFSGETAWEEIRVALQNFHI